VSRITERVRALQALYERIAVTRMAGVPILHPGLQVQAIGFAPVDGGRAAVGVLLTPWFMNLLWLPLQAPGDAPPLPVGHTRVRCVGSERFDFLGADEPGFGPYESCSLFSPMHAFVDQAAAVATAEAVLAALREPVPQTGRRALLLGRRAGASA
jgi:[NiFe] hydrogenase assembly HybE family chaperone